MSTPSDIIKRGTRAAQPTPSANAGGVLYYVTDESIMERWSGTAWESVAEVGGGAGSDTTAIHDNVAAEISAITEKVTPVNADLILIEDSAASNAKKKVQVGNLPGAGGWDPATEVPSMTELTAVSPDDLFMVIDDPSGTPTAKKITAENLTVGGWIPAGETWTYASADDPTFTFTISGDKTSKYSAGMRISLVQTSTKYFIITKVAYSAPDTTITIFGGTDYVLANAAITSPYYSREKAPYGFPLSPAVWTQQTTDTTLRSQSSPADNTWYNLGSLSIVAPIGIWLASYQVTVQANKSGSFSAEPKATLSTANNSQSDANWTADGLVASVVTNRQHFHRSGILSIATKTTYYLNGNSRQGSADNLHFLNDESPCIIRLVSAYL